MIFWLAFKLQPVGSGERFIQYELKRRGIDPSALAREVYRECARQAAQKNSVRGWSRALDMYVDILETTMSGLTRQQQAENVYAVLGLPHDYRTRSA